MLEALQQPWPAFVGLVVVLFVIDLLFGSRGTDVRAAVLWSTIWIGAGLTFGVWIWTTQGSEAGTAYYTAYVLEKSLSVDDIFVFVLIFSELRIPAKQQHRALRIARSARALKEAGTAKLCEGGTDVRTRRLSHALVMTCDRRRLARSQGLA